MSISPATEVVAVPEGAIAPWQVGDLIAPPKLDRWGPGTRVPTVIISPMAKRHHVDHTLYDTTSILRLIENRYGLPPLGSRDLNANDLTNAFDF